jgi:hypothetical protein
VTTGAPIAEEKKKLKWKMTKIGIALISMLFLSLAVVIKPVAGGATVVKVDPSLIEYYEDATGQQFTVAIKIVDVTNLYGFDIKFRWNTTFLDYVSDSVHVPRNATYPDGVLYDPIIFKFVQVNATTGTYWVAYSSRWPAPSFNGSGTVFTMTFKVKYHPVQPQPDAHVTLELYSTDLSDNHGYPIPHTRQNGTVILYALSGGRHDVAVTSVIPWKTVVGRGFTCKINVTVINQGDFTETFNVTLYANTTSIATQAVTLTNGNSTTITFTWNTTGFAKGNYTIKAYAWPVQGETHTTDNTCYSTTSVHVGTPGDINGDTYVNAKDAVLLGKAFGSHQGQAEYNPNADINGDGYCNAKDAVILGSHFNEHDP